MIENNVYDLQKFGNKLFNLRIKGHLTQSKIREINGLHPKTIKNLEYGKTLPTLDTLDKLSELYRTNVYLILEACRFDKDSLLSQFLKKLDQDSLCNNINGIKETQKEIAQLDQSLFTEPIDYHRIKFEQLKLFTEILLIKNKADKMNVSITQQYCLKALSLTHKKFSLTSLNNYYYDVIETRLLISLGFSYLRQQKDQTAIDIIKCSIESAKIHASDPNNMSLLLHAYNALAYCYFILDNHHDVIDVCQKAIEISEKHYNMKLLPNLLFRKGISEYYLNIASHTVTLQKSLQYLELMKMDDLKLTYTNLLKNKYEIQL